MVIDAICDFSVIVVVTVVSFCSAIVFAIANFCRDYGTGRVGPFNAVGVKLRSHWVPAPGGGFQVLVANNLISCGPNPQDATTISLAASSVYNNNFNNDNHVTNLLQYLGPVRYIAYESVYVSGVSCTETDAGNVPLTFGIVSYDGSGFALDTCIPGAGNELTEYRCKNNESIVVTYRYFCPYGCSNGHAIRLAGS